MSANNPERTSAADFAAMHGPEPSPRPCYTYSLILGLGVKPMRRREFITLVGGAAATPLAVRAQQQSGKTARIGLLTRKTDASVSVQIDAFRQGLADLGWVDGTNIRIEHRDAEGQAERLFA